MLECILPLCFRTLIPVCTDMLSVRMWGYFCPAYVRCSNVSVPSGGGVLHHWKGKPESDDTWLDWKDV